MRRNGRVSWLVGCVVAGVAVTMAGVRVVGQTSPRIQAANLSHLGSFKVPLGSGNGLAYGGTALGYNAANDSLFIVGHDWDQLTAEISIPSYGSTATLLQPLRDASAGRLGQIGNGNRKIGGNLVYNNRLYFTGFLFYDADGSARASHFSRPLSLSSGTVTGPVNAGPMNPAFYGGYLGLIPTEWQSRLGGAALTGNCCLSVISRTSYGPAVFAFDPENIGTAQTLVYYDQAHQTLGQYGASGSHPVFNGSTRVRGVVFPQGTSSVLFIGTTGIGPYCYGEADECGDPTNNSKGEHAYPYRAYVWAYDANDLAAVKAGTRQPYSVTPYATWEITTMGSVGYDQVGGAAYDPATGRIFISLKNKDADKPLIHVLKVNISTTGTPAPQAPSSVHIVR